MDDGLLPLLAVSGVQQLAAEVAAWVSRGDAERVAVWHVSGQRKRRVCAVGLPEDWSLPSPPSSPWVELAGRGSAPAPGRPGDALHHLAGPDGATVGALLLPEGCAVASRAPFLGPVLARAAEFDRLRLRCAVFEAALELVDDGLIVANPDGDLLAYSASLEEATGWTPQDIRRHGWTHLVYTDPAVRAEVQRGLAALLRGWPSEGIVRSIARKDGAERRMAIWSRVVPDPAAGPPALLGVFRDVTSDEDARRRSAREEGLAQLGRIAGRIAHEYNNLLCAVMGHAELIEASPGLPEAVARRATTIVRSARRGAHLSSRLLAFTGTTQPRPEVVDVVEVVTQVRDLYAARMPRGVTVQLQPGAEPLWAEVDPAQLQQAVMNLLVNGAESMPRGGELQVRLRVAALPTDVRYVAPHAPPPGSDMIELRVVDQGPGFTSAALAHLFEPFFTEKRDGHGMGLPAVRGMVAAHGGAAHVESGAPPAGAVVTLWLPRSTRPALRLHGPPDEGSAVPARVWLLDDQDAVLEFSRVSLAAAGARVETFGTVAAVLAAADVAPALRPDLLVLDVQLADGDGPSALHALRAHGLQAPVVWITGHTPDTLQMPDGAVLRKPYTGAELVAVAQRVLRGG